jgi:two-component system, LytTR family, response regulator
MHVRVLIVDDERPARNKIRTHLRDRSECEIAGEARDGLEAVDSIRTLRPDLVFLDVQMPGLNGFEVIAAVGADLMPATVFVTAYDEYALQAFDVEAVDYLLKPYDSDRFHKALDRALRRAAEAPVPGASAGRLVARALPGDGCLRRIVVRDQGRLFFVETADLLHVSAEENYVRLHTLKGSQLIRETLDHITTRLNPLKFARISRSVVVGVEYIHEIQPWSHGDYRVLLKDGTHLKLSRRYQRDFFERFR